MSVPIMFERFWSAYPKKEGKGAAIKAWEKATKEMSIDEINDFTDKVVLAIDAQKRSRWDATERQYIPMPSTWLNQCRWLDEIKSKTMVEDRKQAVKTCGCGNPCTTNKVCARCYTKLTAPNLKEEMIATKKKLGIVRNGQEPWRDACMRGLKKNNLKTPYED